MARSNLVELTLGKSKSNFLVAVCFKQYELATIESPVMEAYVYPSHCKLSFDWLAMIQSTFNAEGLLLHENINVKD